MKFKESSIYEYYIEYLIYDVNHKERTRHGRSTTSNPVKMR